MIQKLYNSIIPHLFENVYRKNKFSKKNAKIILKTYKYNFWLFYITMFLGYKFEKSQNRLQNTNKFYRNNLFIRIYFYVYIIENSVNIWYNNIRRPLKTCKVAISK